MVPEVALSALESPVRGQVQVQDLVLQSRHGEAGPHVLAGLGLGAGRLRARIAARREKKQWTGLYIGLYQGMRNPSIV